MTAEIHSEGSLPLEKEEIPPLPFTYIRTEDSALASYKERRVPGIIINGKVPEPRSDAKILEYIKQRHEGREWYMDDRWREKGMPVEQLEMVVGESPITIYNFNKEVPFTQEHEEQLRGVFEKMASHFPDIPPRLRWILIDNDQTKSFFGDPEKYPANGDANQKFKMIRILPRGMQFMPHRIMSVTNFEGTLAHETAHFGEDTFRPEWRDHYSWIDCPRDESWEERPSPDGTKQNWYNKQTGKMAIDYQYPAQPEECITEYATQNMDEDIVDSTVAYLFDPTLLQKISPQKFAILQKHDAQTSVPQVNIARVPKEQIRLPEIKPETVYYYIQEPSANS